MGGRLDTLPFQYPPISSVDQNVAVLRFADEALCIVFQQEALADQLSRCLPHRPHIAVVIVIALAERSSRVATRQPFRPGHCEGDERTAQGAKVGVAPPWRAHIPTGIGSEGSSNLDWPNAGDVQTILVRPGDQQRIAWSKQWRQ